jgi:hypothetical protein
LTVPLFVNLPVSGLSSSPAVLSLCSLVLVRSTLLVQLKVLLLGFDLILWGFPCVAPDGLKGVRFIRSSWFHQAFLFSGSGFGEI